MPSGFLSPLARPLARPLIGLGTPARIKGGGYGEPVGATTLIDGITYTRQSSGAAWGVRQSLSNADDLNFELRPGDRWPDDGDTRERAQLAAVSEKLPFSQSIWMATRLALDGGVPEPGVWMSILGFKQSEDVGDLEGQSGMFGLRLEAGKFELVTRHSDDAIMVSPPITTVHYSQDWDFGRVYDLICRLRFEKTSGGAFDAWLDGTKIVTYRGRVGFNDAIGPYAKIGLYRAASELTHRLRLRGFKAGLSLPANRYPNEYALNGDFGGAGDWTVPATANISGGKLNFAAAGTSDIVGQANTRFEDGASYSVSYTLSGYAGGTFRVLLYGPDNVGQGANRSANGSYTETITIGTGTGSAPNRIVLQPLTGPLTVSVDDLSITKL